MPAQGISSGTDTQHPEDVYDPYEQVQLTPEAWQVNAPTQAQGAAVVQDVKDHPLEFAGVALGAAFAWAAAPVLIEAAILLEEPIDAALDIGDTVNAFINKDKLGISLGAASILIPGIFDKGLDAAKASRRFSAAGKGTTDLSRPYIRKSTREAVEAAAPKTANGKFIDPNTRLPVEGKYDLGHKAGNEFWREKAKAQAEYVKIVFARFM